MPRVYKGVDRRAINDKDLARAMKAIADAVLEIDAFLRTASLGNFGDFETRNRDAGLLAIDDQGRKWRIRVARSGETKGGAELQIAADGATTSARDAGSTGTVIIKVDDAGF